MASPLQDPMFVVVLVFLLLVLLFVYLFLRRTLLSLREGFDEGQK